LVTWVNFYHFNGCNRFYLGKFTTLTAATAFFTWVISQKPVGTVITWVIFENNGCNRFYLGKFDQKPVGTVILADIFYYVGNFLGLGRKNPNGYFFEKKNTFFGKVNSSLGGVITDFWESRG